MDILDHLLKQDADTTQHQLDLCRSLTRDQWLKTFEFGQGSLYDTFDHLIDSKEYWTSLLLGQPGPFIPAPTNLERSLEAVIQRNETITPVFIAVARQLQDANRLDNLFLDTETGPARRTYGSCIAHVVTHSMHHRAQALVMFDLLGIAYNPFMGAALDSYPIE